MPQKFDAQQLVHTTAKFRVLASRRINHTRIIENPINDALHTVTGCVRPSPTNNLPVLAGIENHEISDEKSQIAVARQVRKQHHLQHDRLHSRLTKQQRHLKSILPFAPAAFELLQDLQNKEQLQTNMA